MRVQRGEAFGLASQEAVSQDSSHSTAVGDSQKSALTPRLATFWLRSTLESHRRTDLTFRYNSTDCRHISIDTSVEQIFITFSQRSQEDC